MAQTTVLSLASGSTVQGGSAALALSLSGSTASAIQWTLSYSAADVASVIVAAGPALAAAGKTVQCSTGSGSTVCLAYGLNSNTIADGIVAVVTVTLAPLSSVSVPISVGATMGAMGAGAAAVAVSGTGGSITIAALPVQLPGSDTQAPSVPSGLWAAAISSSQINLSWNPSTDNVGVTGYKIFRNGVQAGAATTSAYTDTGLSASTTYTYRVSAFDLAGNNSGQSAPASATTLNPSGSPPPPVSPTGTSIWSSSTVPPIPWNNDASITVGVKFRSDVSGSVTGIRFYKGAGNNGTHIGLLYSSAGALIAQGTFSGETASGWQQVNFPGAVSIAANTTYIAAYFSTSGYAFSQYYFTSSGTDSAPLHALRSGVDGPNGVFMYGDAPQFPSSAYTDANYWVDIAFSASGSSPSPTGTSIWSSSTVPAIPLNNDAPITVGVKFRSDVSGSVTGIRFYKGAGNNGTHVGLLYSSAGAVLAQATFSAETASGWQQVTFPGAVSIAANTTYIAAYFTTSGYAFSQYYFTSSGTDSTPLHALQSGVDGPNGVFMYGGAPQFPSSAYTDANYWVDIAFSASGSSPSPLSPTVTSLWSSSTVPAIPWNNDASITVGVKFRSDVSGLVTGIRFYKGTGNNGTHIGLLYSSTGIPLAQATFSGETASGWQQVNFPSAVSIAANTTYIAAYFTTSGYAFSQYYFTSSGTDSAPLHALLSGVDGPNGVFMYGGAPQFPSSAYTDANYWVDIAFSASGSPPPSTVTSLWSSSTVPAVPWENDGPVTLGVKFRSDVSGIVTGIRFYKGAGNNGTHIGLLYSSAGVPLAQATFSGETAAGWQQVNFPGAVAIAANTTYIAAFFSTSGFARTLNYFTSSGTDSLPLHALRSGVDGPNGVYMYGGAPQFPSFSYGDSNYWVDIAFSAGGSPPPPTVTSLWSSSTVPAVPWENDAPVTLGVKFRSDVSGSVTGIRFYKGAGNNGVHIGLLYSSTGIPLAQATFTGETAVGWQQVNFPSAVSIAANTTYIVAFFSTSGFARNLDYFTSSGTDSPPLHALRSGVDGLNGVYMYGGAPQFPSFTYADSNYWVDLLFAAN